MNNQMILRAMYESTIKMDENELYHHGVKDMSWGERNGPPYPLSGSNKKEAKLEYKEKREREKRLEKMRKAAAKKRKEQAKEQKKQEKIDKMKLRLMKKGKVKQIAKKAKYFAPEEIEYAMERNRQLTEARYTKDPKKAPDPHAMEKLMNVVDKVGKIATAAVPVVTLMKGASELKNMGIDRELQLQKAQNDAMESKIKLIRESDPEAAARLTARYTGEDVKYNPKKESPKASDIKTISEALMKVNPQAAARYLRDQTGYGGTVSSAALANNPAYKGSKNVKSKIENLTGSSTKKVSLSNGAKRRGQQNQQNQQNNQSENQGNANNSSQHGRTPTPTLTTAQENELASRLNLRTRGQGIGSNPAVQAAATRYGVKYNNPVTSQEISRLSSNTIGEGNNQLKFITKRLRENGEYMSPLAFQMREAQSNSALNSLERYSRNARNK